MRSTATRNEEGDSGGKVFSTVVACPECGGPMVGGCCQDCGKEMTANAWSDEARQAATEARSKSQKADAASKKAEDGGSREHMDAYKAHVDAAYANAKAAVHQESKGGNNASFDKAHEHKEMADHHLGMATAMGSSTHNQRHTIWQRLGQALGITANDDPESQSGFSQWYPKNPFKKSREELAGKAAAAAARNQGGAAGLGGAPPLGPGNHSLKVRSDHAKRTSGSVDDAEEAVDQLGEGATDEDIKKVAALHKEAQDAHTAAFKEAAEGRATGAEVDYAAAGHHQERARFHGDQAALFQAKADLLGKKTNVTNELIGNNWSDAARAAAAEARKSGTFSNERRVSAIATEASAHAGKMETAASEKDDEHKESGRHEAMMAHREAANAHLLAAREHNGTGDALGRGENKAAVLHTKAALAHQDAARQLSKPTGNTWSDAARAAAVEARLATSKAHAASAKTGINPGSTHSSAAEEKGTGRESKMSPTAHNEVAGLHEKAAAAHSKEAGKFQPKEDEDAHKNAAGLHRAAADAHRQAAVAKRGTMNGVENVWTEEARQAAAEARQSSSHANSISEGAKGDNSASEHAHEAGMRASDRAGHDKASMAHGEAADHHAQQAEEAEKKGDSHGAYEHKEAEAAHRDASFRHSKASARIKATENLACPTSNVSDLFLVKNGQLVINPAVSEAQRRYLNSQFGHDWVKEHGFDNKGELPEEAEATKNLKKCGLAENAWSEEARQAAVEARQKSQAAHNATGKTEGKEKSESASGHSHAAREGGVFAKTEQDHKDAAGSHRSAELEHVLAKGKSPTAVGAERHDAAAKAHGEAAAAHEKAAGMKAKKPVGNTEGNDMNFDLLPRDARLAAFAKMGDGSAESRTAREATMNAERRDGTGAGAHKEAASLHAAASVFHKANDREAVADAHERMASYHTNKARAAHDREVARLDLANTLQSGEINMQLNAEQRERIITDLVSNKLGGQSGFGQASRPFLAGLTDDALSNVARNYLKANAAKGGDDDDDDDDDVEDNAGGDTHSFDDGKASAGSAQAGGKGTKEEYSEEKNKLVNRNQRVANQLRKLGKRYPDLVEPFENAVRIDNQAKVNVIKRLVANLRDPNERKLMVNELADKTLRELEKLAKLLPPAQNQSEVGWGGGPNLVGGSSYRPVVPNDPLAVYYGQIGAGPAATQNQAADEGDTLGDPPTINFDEERGKKQKQTA